MTHALRSVAAVLTISALLAYVITAAVRAGTLQELWAVYVLGQVVVRPLEPRAVRRRRWRNGWNPKAIR